jgi:outer membrane protein insertion porin family
MARVVAAAIALAVALAAMAPLAALAASPPGVPRPSRGAPGDQPGTTPPFGTEGGKALESRSEAEREVQGTPLLIERIEISGSARIPASVILEHVPVRAGDVATPLGILEARARLVQLGAFSDVEVTTAPGSAPDRIVLRFHVVEGNPWIIGDFMLAQTPVARPYAGLTLGNASALGLGRGAAIAGATDGGDRSVVRGTLYEPDLPLGGRSVVGGLQLIWQRGLESGCATPSCGGHYAAIPWVRYQRTGGELDVGFRPGVFSRMLFGYRLESLHVRSDPGVSPAARPPLPEGNTVLSALVITFDRDTRTDAFLPQYGSRLLARIDIGTAAIGSDYEYSRYVVEAEQWLPLRGVHALRLDAALGLLQGNAPAYDLFYAADWSYFSVGVAAPRFAELNFSSDSRYDTFLAVAGAEYSLRVWSAQPAFFRRGFVAFGVRTVFTAATPGGARSLVSQVPVSFDLAVRVETRIGIFGIGLGYLIDQVLKAVPLHVPGVTIETRRSP